MVANRKMPMLHNEGTHNAQLDVLQLPRAARRRVHAGHRWHGHGKQGRSRPLGVRRGRQFAECQSRLALLWSANGFRRGLQRTGVQPLRCRTPSGQRKRSSAAIVTSRTRKTTTLGCRRCCCFGTGFLNYMSRWAWVATGKKGFEAIAIAERDEPPAVLGSDLHKIAYPDRYKKHEEDHGELKESQEHARQRARRATAWRISFTPPWVKRASASSTSPTSTTRISPSA